MTLPCITGCNLSIFKSKGDKAVEFVEEKYGIQIDPQAYESGGFVTDSDTVWCYAEGMDRENEDLLILITKENGETVYHDNYFNYIATPMIEEYASAFFSEQFDDFKLYNMDNRSYFANELNYGSTMEDLYTYEPRYLMDVRVFVKEDGSTYEEYERRMLAVEDSIKKCGRDMAIMLIVVKEEIYEQIERYGEDVFWDSIGPGIEPDNEHYFYYYEELIADGERM